MTSAVSRALATSLIILGVLGCGPPQPTADADQPVNNLTPMPTTTDPYAPQPGDSDLQKGNAFVEEAGVLVLESFPPQFQLHVSGNLPDPCHELRIAIGQPDTAKYIAVQVYSVVDPAMICIQVLKPFSANANLGTYPPGHYTVTVNGETAGEFDAP